MFSKLFRIRRIGNAVEPTNIPTHKRQQKNPILSQYLKITSTEKWAKFL